MNYEDHIRAIAVAQREYEKTSSELRAAEARDEEARAQCERVRHNFRMWTDEQVLCARTDGRTDSSAD